MAKKLKSIGFGQFKSGLASAIGNVVSDALKNETQGLLGSVDAQIAKELRNADRLLTEKRRIGQSVHRRVECCKSQIRRSQTSNR